jgi:phosphate/sulfate permease
MSRSAIAFLELQPSEAVVVAAASRFFAAYIAGGRVTEETEEQVMRYCVRAAIRLALETDNLVQSDEEEW